MRRTAIIKKTGIRTNGHISAIRTIRVKSSQVDLLTIVYKDRATGQPYTAKATTQVKKFKVGDMMEIAYLPSKPTRYAITDTKGGYTFLLVFCIIIFLFVLFAVYKINDMVKTGQM